MNTDLVFGEQDDFNREPIARKVCRIIQHSGISPILIDGGWGTGKTTFCHKLKNLTDTAWHTAYIDAFRIDSCEQPLIAVLAEVLKLIPDTSNRNNYRKKIAPLIRGSIKASLQIGTKLLTRNSVDEIEEIFDTEFSKDTDKLVEDGTKTLTDKAFEQLSESVLKDQEEAEKNLKLLHQVLTEICKDSSYVIFIDELDRCRPDFSIKMLETIKHVFDIPNLSFVLVANTSILKASIQHHYGKNVDSEIYLEKFIGFKFTLPTLHNNSENKSKHASCTYFEIQVNKSDTLEQCKLLEDHSGLIMSLVSHNKLSLRSVEKLVRNLEIYHILSNENESLSPEVSSFIRIQRILAIFIFTINEEISDSIARGILPYEDINLILGSRVYKTFGNIREPKSELEVLQHLLIISGSDNPKSGTTKASILQNFSNKYTNLELDKSNYSKHICEAMRLLKHLSNTY